MLPTTLVQQIRCALDHTLAAAMLAINQKNLGSLRLIGLPAPGNQK
jgi:hypothetical protein